MNVTGVGGIAAWNRTTLYYPMLQQYLFNGKDWPSNQENQYFYHFSCIFHILRLRYNFLIRDTPPPSIRAGVFLLFNTGSASKEQLDLNNDILYNLSPRLIRALDLHCAVYVYSTLSCATILEDLISL